MRTTLIALTILLSNSLVKSQITRIIKLADLEKRIHNNLDTTYIVNFWATWCMPCVKELPAFDTINSKFKFSKIKVLLVSIDFAEDLETKLVPFIIRKKIASEVLLLDEVNGNYFIPKISEKWSGAIPATMIINNKRNVNLFFERQVNYEFLVREINNLK